MAGWKSKIRDGDWLVLRWARQAGLSEVMNRVALVARGDPAEGLSYHLKRVRKVDGAVLLASDNPAFPPLPAAAGDEDPNSEATTKGDDAEPITTEASAEEATEADPEEAPIVAAAGVEQNTEAAAE